MYRYLLSDQDGTLTAPGITNSVMKMILTDLDHTLLHQDGTISDYTLSVISECRARGCLFAIATARYRIGAERYINELRPDYEITTDGTLIHSGDTCIYSCEFDADVTDQLINRLLSAVPDSEITVAVGNTVYWNSLHISESEKLHKAVYNDYSKPLGVRVNKIVAELPDEKIARRIADDLGCKLQSYRGERWYAFLPEGSGKITAIKALSASCNIPVSDFIAFGDDKNDIDMLKLCGRGVAVANAVPEVLAIADDVTLSNDEDGVAHYLSQGGFL